MTRGSDHEALARALAAAEDPGAPSAAARARRSHRDRPAAPARGFDAAGYLAQLAERGLRFLARSSPEFPSLLAAIHDPPPGLFLRGDGDVELLGRPAVAIVGARSCSPYGAQVARLLGRELAAAGAVVVSGLARGVDGEAHRGALEADGSTVAVLGCGIDRDYPASHRELARRICRRGLVVSEYPPGVEPAPWRFPARNRIVAGLAAATVIVEARERSGALITADFGLEEGREVFAVPGPITSALSAGTNGLLRLGAPPLTGSADVLECLGLEPPPQPDPTLSAAAAAVLSLLGEGGASTDELARRAGLPAGATAAVLVELELAGLAYAAEGVWRAARPVSRAPAGSAFDGGMEDTAGPPTDAGRLAASLVDQVYNIK